MADENENVVADVAELAAKAEAAEHNEAIITNVIAAANERVEQAERTAEEVAAAAMESARGQEITELKREFYSWQNQHSEMKAQMLALQEQVANLSLLLTAMPVSISAQEQSLLTPAKSEIQEAITEVQQILPGTLQNVAAENPVALTPLKRARLI